MHGQDRRLLDTAKAAQRVADFLDNEMAMVFLQAESDTEIEHIVLIQIQLAACGKSRQNGGSVIGNFNFRRKGEKGTWQSSRNKFISPKDYCALIIAEAWLHLRGSLPPPSSKEAADAARAFWLACDGAAGWGDDPRAGWNDSFNEVASDVYAAELDPLYLDTAIKRWQRMTGSKAHTHLGETYELLKSDRRAMS